MKTINRELTYPHPLAAVLTAAQGAIDGLGGKQIASTDDGRLEARFDKKILGRVLGERTHLSVAIEADGNGSRVALSAYPLDAVGRPLQFGFRKGVTETVVDWFVAHLEHRLPQ